MAIYITCFLPHTHIHHSSLICMNVYIYLTAWRNGIAIGPQVTSIVSSHLFFKIWHYHHLSLSVSFDLKFCFWGLVLFLLSLLRSLLIQWSNFFSVLFLSSFIYKLRVDNWGHLDQMCTAALYIFLNGISISEKPIFQKWIISFDYPIYVVTPMGELGLGERRECDFPYLLHVFDLCWNLERKVSWTFFWFYSIWD